MNLGYFLDETKIPCLKGMDTKKRLSGKMPSNCGMVTFPVKWGVTYLL